MTAAKSQSASGTILAVNMEEPALDALAGTFGRSSPPYGLVTAMTEGCLDLHSAPIDDHACAPMFAISEPDPLKTVTAAVDSPCVGVCSTTFDDVCIGCGRTVSEVAQWAVMADDQKQLVWQRIVLKGFPRGDKRNPPT